MAVTLSPIIAVAIVATAPAQIAAPPAPARFQPPERQLLAWTIGDIRCGGDAVTMTRTVQPQIVQTYLGSTAIVAPLTMSFTIDVTGRAVDIARGDQSYAPETADVAPSLAASGFAAAAPHADCRIVYLPRRMTLDSASLSDLRTFAITPNVRPDREVFRRTYPAGNDCFDPAPEVRLRGFPPFGSLPPNPAQIAWSMTGFDIDSTGRPVHLQTVDGTHDTDLDTASRTAVAASRFEAKARHGCIYPYYQTPAILPSPMPADTASLRPAGSTCPIKSGWVTEPRLVFPAAWNRRKIEGWAIVGFDVAPWGATGNVHVLAAQPAAEFGVAASNIIRSATKPKSSIGYTGCIERVRYRIAPPGEPEKPGSDVPPPID